MGRLYDRKDLAFNLEYWRIREAELSAAIANGHEPASILDEVLNYQMACSCNSPCGRPHYKRTKVRDSFELERKREYMKLLRTSTLLSDLNAAQRNFDECGQCHLEASKKRGRSIIVECPVHRPALKKAKSNVYWAGERNLAERNARGQLRTDEPLSAQEALEGEIAKVVSATDAVNPLNQWEEMYQRAKADGYWPAEAKDYDLRPEEINYRGYLWVLRFEDEMTEAEYLAELERLRTVERELEESALQWAGVNTLHQGQSKVVQGNRTVFRRASRFNQTAV